MERKITREQFYQESLKLFFEKGYKATSMRNIAQRLNIQAATLYNYVKSKEGLLEVLLFDIADRFHAGMKDIQTSSYSPIEKLKALVALNVRLTVAHPYSVSMLINEWKNLEAGRREKFLENRNSYESMLREIIDEGIKCGELRPMNLDLAMEAILSSIRWLFTWYSRESGQSPNPVELEKQMADFILFGVSANPSKS
ncbi:MAG: TetR/AcrR family transcriptional regulator [Bacteroidota bacterium]